MVARCLSVLNQRRLGEDRMVEMKPHFQETRWDELSILESSLRQEWDQEGKKPWAHFPGEKITILVCKR